MAFDVGDQVYVARSLLGIDGNDVSPFYRTTVRARNNRSVRVDLPGGAQSGAIATSKVTANFGVLIVRIGDFNEGGLLDPLAKSVLHYSRMLLPGDSVRLIELRTEGELTTFWREIHGMCQQVIIVGHGAPDGYLFGSANITPQRLGEIFDAPNPTKKEFISLGCQTGYKAFGQPFSQTRCVSHFLAPFHSVHGCVASLFTQTFLNERLLASRSTRVAFKHARSDLKGAASFRLWENGKLTAGPV
ncbi:hypothetical protein [Pyruvatibacter sp.]|uniref:hypothetical protein n=1 Tax=Pyruvatibacter sp. TaxID=1981328 RepID=UPI0032EAB4FD